MAELFMLQPLFPGENAVDQFISLCKILGTPKEAQWPDAFRLFPRLNMAEMPQYKKKKLSEVVKNASNSALQVLEMMLAYDPVKRPSADELMTHPYFAEINDQYYEFEKRSKISRALSNKPKTNQNTYESMKITEEGIRIMTMQGQQVKEKNSLPKNILP